MKPVRARSLVLVIAVGLTLTSCARYYYGRPGAAAADFRADTTECAREFGIQSPNKQVALVSPEIYRRCMLAKGWTREKRIEPVDAGWFRGIENDEPVDLALGPKQPDPEPTSSARMHCWRRYIEGRSAWREQLPAYRECMGQ